MNNDDLITLTREVEARSKSNTHRIDKLEERQDSFDKLVSSVAVMAEKQDRMETDLGEIKTDVKSLAMKPSKRWDAVVDKVILCIIGAVCAYMLAKVGF